MAPRIPGGNGIFGGSRAPGRNSWAAFGARPQPGRWDSKLLLGFPWGGGDFGDSADIARLCAGDRRGWWGGSSPGLEPRLCSPGYTGGCVWAHGASVSPPWGPSVLQCPTRAPWEAKFPLWVTSRGSPCPCRCPRCSCGVTAAPGLGAAPPVPAECGSQGSLILHGASGVCGHPQPALPWGPALKQEALEILQGWKT